MKRLNLMKTTERAFANCNMHNKSLLPSGRYAQEGGFQLSFDPPFDLQYTSTILYIVDLVAFTCGIEFTIIYSEMLVYASLTIL